VTLRKNVSLGPAIRMRGATVFVAVLACALVFLPPSKTTFAVGIPQSGYSDKNFVVAPGRELNAQISSSPSSSPSGEEVSASAQTTFPTRENLQLTLKAECANVEIFTDASNEVSYSAWLGAKIAGPEADALGRNLLLTAHNTPRGVVLIAPAATEGECRLPVHYTIHVPRRYNLDIAVQSGDIITQDIEGSVTLISGGGNIEAGSAGRPDRDARFPARTTFTVRLETAGGNISIGDVAGGLHAATAGGRIFAHDVRGPAVLRTGGGDIHAGHIFGPARFVSGGGDINVQKIDGGLWADTAGGRIAIGNAARATAFLPGFPPSSNDASPIAVTRLTRERQEAAPISDLAEITTFARVFDPLVWGGIRVDPVDQQRRVSQAVAPNYPDVARWAGIEGEVTLRIFIGADGTVRSVVPLLGPPVLARAAVRAVEQWRYAPALVDGHPVDIVTTVTLAFRLHR
jgi:TonB family protein